MTFDLFDASPQLERIPMPDAEVMMNASFLDQPKATSALHELIDKTPWRAEEIVVWGKRVSQPRLIAWFGDEGKSYTYSGIKVLPLPWTDLLLKLRDRVEEATDEKFNSVLLNYYRNEKDSMGHHSDDEPDLGPRPVIASVSLGQERIFTFKHKNPGVSPNVQLALTNGSLLVMKGETQRYWKHGIAKSAKPMGPRVNLTFRQILPR